MKDLVPIGNHVVIQQVKNEVKSAGGIILQNSPYENIIEGVVVSVGEGRLTNDNTLVKMRVKKGDRVLYHQFAATTLPVSMERRSTLWKSQIFLVSFLAPKSHCS